MSITVVGLLEADLPGAIEYKDGGVGPLFREARVEEPIELFEFLSRSIAALKRLKITDAISCYIDDIELFRDDDEGEESDFDLILRNAKEATADGSGISFYLMLSHHDKLLSHVITFEASVDHPAENAALSVLDTARLIDEGEDDDEEEEDDERKDSDFGFASDTDKPEAEASGPLAPVDDDMMFFDDRASKAQDQVEAFLQRILAALEKELGVSEPEIDVWTDWEGVYTLETAGVPGLPGITG